MRKKAITLDQADRVIGVLKQFTAEVAKAASGAIKELTEVKADSEHKHTVADISNFPNSLPANGGNALTVNGYTVETNVPLGAKFTDTVYIHPAHTAKSSGLYKITVDGEGHVTAVTEVTKADITALGIPAQDTNTTYGAATQSANGLLSAADKKKLDGVAEGANKYVHPAHTAKSSGLYKITVDGEGHVTAVTEVTKADITALGIPAQDTNTTYSDATESVSGLFSANNLKKLNGIANGAQVNSITGVKGNAENSYRTGQVNLTAANIGAATASHTHVISGSTSIPASGWKTDSNEKFPYYYDLSISGVAASDRVDINVAIASADTAITCGLCPLTEAFAGKVRLRAKKAPTAAISVEYWIMKK